ncbi:MAG: 4Fe-4S cluster-binding domain-containing protein [Nitrospiraceae bacterium]|nr:4Fe-4S cluster-binding domain-containing protein [Nitrospiraceae bacterium]
MKYFPRPDAIAALDAPVIRKIFPRYREVVRGQLPAVFQILKEIKAEFDERADIEALWDVHERSMRVFYEIRRKIDAGEIRPEDQITEERSLLDLKLLLVKRIMESCQLCERRCKVNRWAGELGICRVGDRCLISSEFIHMGEEPYITPSHTIFFMGCPLKCQFCQNWAISQWYEEGTEIEGKTLAGIIDERKKEGARNVNFVGGEPTPQLFWIIESLKYCNENVAVVWNSNMYMTEKTMNILNGVVDMYLSDFKYGNDGCALRLSKVNGYFGVASRNHLIGSGHAEMTVRHLVLPGHIECCTKPVLKWIAENIRERCLVNLMDQYYPCWKAHLYPDINRRLTQGEFEDAVGLATLAGLNFIR